MKHTLRLVAAAVALALSSHAAAQGLDAAALFGQKCAVCHGKTGTPLPVFANQGVRNFRDAKWQASQTDAALQQAIAKGREGTLMRAFEKELSKAQIEALVKHIRTLK